MNYPEVLAKETIEKGMQTEQLRDEIYAQIVKQLTNNENPESVAKLWQLMQFCLQHFSPTPILENYLEAWLRNQSEQYWYTIATLHETQERGPKQSVPSPEDLKNEVETKKWSPTKAAIVPPNPKMPPVTPVDEVVAVIQTNKYTQQSGYDWSSVIAAAAPPPVVATIAPATSPPPQQQQQQQQTQPPPPPPPQNYQ